MSSVLIRLQDWYKGNCNGDWEHSYGILIETLDNPGWQVKIDLLETDLEHLQFSREFQNPKQKDDWFTLKIENGTLNIACGPDSLETALTIFLDEIVSHD